MICFLDGPAAGIPGLFLRRAPRYLRVVHRPGQWDALDQLTDRPDPAEAVYAYRRVTRSGWLHLRAGRGNPSGFFAIGTYRVVDPQPAEAELRDTERWRAWAAAQAGADRLPTPSPTEVSP